MISNNHLHAQALCQINLSCTGDPAVHCDDESCPVPADLLNGLPVKAITLFQPVGHVRCHRYAEIRKKMQKHCSGSEPVRIIISIYGDFVTGLHGSEDGF